MFLRINSNFYLQKFFLSIKCHVNSVVDGSTLRSEERTILLNINEITVKCQFTGLLKLCTTLGRGMSRIVSKGRFF